MPYRVLQGGMFNGKSYTGGDEMSDDDAEAMPNLPVLLATQWLEQVAAQPAKAEPPPEPTPEVRRQPQKQRR